MKIKFDAEVKSGEWLALACFIVIVFLLLAGHSDAAIRFLTRWLGSGARMTQ